MQPSNSGYVEKVSLVDSSEAMIGVAGNPLPVTLVTGDNNIGAVEIKNATDDTRATVGANGLHVDVRNIQTGGIPLIAHDGMLGTIDYTEMIALGGVSAHDYAAAIGLNENIPNTLTDVAEIGNIPLPPDTGIQMRLVSTNANDTWGGAGTGARRVELHYLDANLNEQAEIVPLQGTTPVNTVAANIRRVQMFHVYEVGSGGVPAGDISLQNTAATVTYAKILAGFNRYLQAMWTVPAGKIGLLYLVSFSASGNKPVFITVRATAEDMDLLANCFVAQDIVFLQNSIANLSRRLPIRFPAGTDIKVSARSTGAGVAQVTASFVVLYQ